MKKSITKLMAALMSVAMLVTMLPVVSLAAATGETAVDLSTGTLNPTGYNLAPKTLTGLGGSGSDVAYGWDFTAYSSADSLNPARIDLNVSSTVRTTPFTFEFNMYGDGNAIPAIGYASGTQLLYWDVDGTIYYNYDGTMTAYSKKFDRGQWLHVGISHRGSGRYCFWVNDEYLTDFSKYTSPGTLCFMTSADSYNGYVAYKDVVTYDGIYLPYGTTTLTCNHDNTDHNFDVADNDTVQINPELKTVMYKPGADFSTLANEIKVATSAASISLYDEALTTQATTIEEAEIAVIKTTGNVYHYYTVSQRELTQAEKFAMVNLALGDGVAAAYKGRIQVLDGNIAVFSYTQKSSQYISSEDLLASLTSKYNEASGIGGYTLSYVLEENGEDVQVDSVTGGYIKAVKEDADTVYIPIVKKINEKTLNMATAGALGTYDISNQGYGATKTNLAGIAGKATDDTAYGFTPNGGVSNPGNGYRYQLNANYDASTSTWKSADNTTYTYVFNVYADGNSAFALYNASTVYLKWTSSGDVYFYDDAISAMSTVSAKNIAREQWHQFAVTVESASHRAQFYVDGEPITSPTWQTPYGSYQTLGIGIDSYNAGSTTGKVLLDDVVYYEGYYYADDEVVSPAAISEDFLIDTDSRIIYYQNMTEASALTSAIDTNTDASAMAVYTDNTYAASATTLDNANNVVVLTSPNGLRLEYYTLKGMSELPDPEFTFEHSASVFATTTNVLKADENLTLYIASYNAENKLLEIYTAVIPAGQYITRTDRVAYGDSDAAFVKAFLWTANQTPVGYGYSKVPASAE